MNGLSGKKSILNNWIIKSIYKVKFKRPTEIRMGVQSQIRFASIKTYANSKFKNLSF